MQKLTLQIRFSAFRPTPQEYYDLRHYFITTALAFGADIGALAKVVDSSPETIRKFYQHVTDDHRMETVLKITLSDFGPQDEGK